MEPGKKPKTNPGKHSLQRRPMHGPTHMSHQEKRNTKPKVCIWVSEMHIRLLGHSDCGLLGSWLHPSMWSLPWHLVSPHILSDPSPLLLPFLPLSAALGRIKPYSQNWVVWALLKFAETAKPDNLVLTDHCISSAQKFLAPSGCQARGWSDGLSPH